MKRIVINGIKVIAFAALMLGVIFGAYKIVSWKDTTGGYLSSTSQLYHTPENHIDAVFLGSSHCYCGIYPAVMWRDAGIAAFDMSVSGQDKASTYHTLVELLKKQSPKVVCVDMYGLTFERHGVEGNVYRNMLSMKLSKNSVDLVKEYVEEEKQKDYILRWPIVHTRYTELEKYDFVQYEPSVYGRGAFFQWVTTKYPVNLNGADTEEIGVLSEENEKWLQDLYDLSVEKGFDLIFYVTPFQIYNDQQALMNAAAEFASEKGIEFVDLNKLRYVVELDMATDFCDEFHLNALGAEKVSGYFAGMLRDVYDLSDHRGDDSYDLWEKDYKWYQHMEAAEKLKSISNAGEYADYVTALEDVVSVISLEAGFADSGEFFYDLTERIGIPGEESAVGGKWILVNGNVEKVLENDPDAEPYVMDLSKYDTLRVQYTDQLIPSNIMINMEEYSQKYYCMTILTYDMFLGEVIESRGF